LGVAALIGIEAIERSPSTLGSLPIAVAETDAFALAFPSDDVDFIDDEDDTPFAWGVEAEETGFNSFVD